MAPSGRTCGNRTGASRRQVGAAVVEFALIAPLFFAVVIGLFSAALYVLEVQVANQAAQAGARWAVATDNFPGPVDSANPPGCPASQSQVPSTSGILTAAKSASGPFANSMTVDYNSASYGSAPGCQVTVQVPYVSSGGFFNLGPTSITATAIDYVT